MVQNMACVPYDNAKEISLFIGDLTCIFGAQWEFDSVLEIVKEKSCPNNDDLVLIDMLLKNLKM